jgi:hypothetical protein
LFLRLVNQRFEINPLRDWIDLCCSEVRPVLVDENIAVVQLLTDASQAILV